MSGTGKSYNRKPAVEGIYRRSTGVTAVVAAVGT